MFQYLFLVRLQALQLAMPAPGLWIWTGKSRACVSVSGGVGAGPSPAGNAWLLRRSHRPGAIVVFIWFPTRGPRFGGRNTNRMNKWLLSGLCCHSCDCLSGHVLPPCDWAPSTCRQEGAKHSRASFASHEGRKWVWVNRHIPALSRRGQAAQAFSSIAKRFILLFF